MVCVRYVPEEWALSGLSDIRVSFLEFCAKTAPRLACAHAKAAARMEDENNTQNLSAADAARIAKQHAVVRLFNPTLSDREFTDEACTRTERLRAAAAGDLATLARTQDAGRMTALMVACRRKQLTAVVKLLASSTASTLKRFQTICLTRHHQRPT